MPDGLLEGFGKTAQLFSAIASALAVLAFLVEFVRGRSETKSFRPAMAWAVAVLGLVASSSAVIALRDRHLSPFSHDGRLLALTAVVGVLLVVAGACTALLTPSADRNFLHEVASAVEAAVWASEVDDNFVRSQYVQLGLSVHTQLAWFGSTGSSKVRSLSSATMPTASVSVMFGPTGCGKSVEVRHHVLETCRAAKHSRRPVTAAVYVSLRGLAPIDEPITQDTVLLQLEEAVGKSSRSLGEKFRRRLDSDARGPRWLFVFDLDGELPRDREEQYFQALRNFMRHRIRDRALIVVRIDFPDAQPAFTPRDPTFRHVQELLRSRGVTGPLDDVVRDLSLGEVYANPAMITQFGADVVNTGAHTRSLPELLDAFISTRLTRHSTVNQSPDSLRDKAERIAYHLTVELPLVEADLDPPPSGHLGRVEGGVFAFRFPLLRTHLAAAYFVRHHPKAYLPDMVRTEATRQVLVAALLRGDDVFRDEFVAALTEVVRTGITEPVDHGSTALPPLGTFTWPPVVLHALNCARDAMRRGAVITVEPALRSMIDHLVWQGVFGGGKRDREASLALLSLASPGRLLDLHRQAVSLRYEPYTTSKIAEHLRWSSRDLEGITLHERAIVLVNALLAAFNGNLVLRREGGTGEGLLGSMFRELVGVSRTSAGVLVIILVGLAANSTTVVAAALECVLILVLVFLLWRSRKPDKMGASFVAMLVFGVGLGSIAGTIGSLTSLLASAFTLEFFGFLRALPWIWVFTWPLAMVVQIIHAPNSGRRWWAPQWDIVELRAYRDELAHYSALLDTHFGHLRSRSRQVVLAVSAAVLLLLPVDLPIRGEVERFVDFPLLLVILLVDLVVVVGPRKRRDVEAEDVLGRLIFSGGMTDDRLLREFTERADRGHHEVGLLFTMLAEAPAGSLHGSVRMLQSLDGLLEFIKRTLPDSMTSAIRPGLWRYLPDSCALSLKRWAEVFDRKHVGFLVTLANSDSARIDLGCAIDGATAHLPATAG